MYRKKETTDLRGCAPKHEKKPPGRLRRKQLQNHCWQGGGLKGEGGKGDWRPADWGGRQRPFQVPEGTTGATEGKA